jgi:hypothetical protein
LWSVCGSCPVAISGLPVRWCRFVDETPHCTTQAPPGTTSAPQTTAGLQPTVFMGGAVWRGAVSWRNWRIPRQKRGKCERNGVVSAREAAMGTQGCIRCNWPFLRCATVVSLPASASPAPVTTRVRAPAARPAFSFFSAVRGGPAWAALPLFNLTIDRSVAFQNAVLFRCVMCVLLLFQIANMIGPCWPRRHTLGTTHSACSLCTSWAQLLQRSSEIKYNSISLLAARCAVYER